MGSALFRCEVVRVEGRTLALAIEVADGQSVAGMGAEAMPRSAAFALQWLVETTWSARGSDPRLQALTESDGAALRVAAPGFIESYTMGPATGFPIHEPGYQYNERVERGMLAPARFTAIVVVTDPALLRHLAAGARWDSPCGHLFE